MSSQIFSVNFRPLSHHLQFTCACVGTNSYRRPETQRSQNTLCSGERLSNHHATGVKELSENPCTSPFKACFDSVSSPDPHRPPAGNAGAWTKPLAENHDCFAMIPQISLDRPHDAPGFHSLKQIYSNEPMYLRSVIKKAIQDQGDAHLGKPHQKKKRKSSDNVTRGGGPPPRQLGTAWGGGADPPPSSDSLGVRT